MAEAKTKKVPALRITAKTERFSRAGETFTREPRTIPTADLTKDQVKALKAEYMLVVEEVEAEVDVSKSGD